MADQQDALASAFLGELVQEPGDAINGFAPAFALRVSLIERLRSFSLQLLARHAIERPVVALTKSPVTMNRDLCPAESDLCRLHGAPEVRGEHDSDPVIPSALPKLCRKSFPCSDNRPSSHPVAPSDFVVLAQRMGLEDHFDAHHGRGYSLVRQET